MKSRLEKLAYTTAAGALALGMSLPATAEAPKSPFGNAKLVPIEQVASIAQENAQEEYIEAEAVEEVAQVAPATIEEKTVEATPAEPEKKQGKWVFENWGQILHYGTATPHATNEGITVATDSFQVGYNFRKVKPWSGNFFGPVARVTGTYEPTNNLPWFNRYELGAGLMFQEGGTRLVLEGVHGDYLSNAQFENFEYDWSVAPEDRKPFNALRATASHWAEQRKGKLVSFEEWAGVTWFGPGHYSLEENDVRGLVDLEANLNVLRWHKPWGDLPQNSLSLFLNANAAYDTKSLPWNNIWEASAGLKLKIGGIRGSIEFVHGDYHSNANFVNIGEQGWDMPLDERESYNGVRVMFSAWHSMKPNKHK